MHVVTESPDASAASGPQRPAGQPPPALLAVVDRGIDLVGERTDLRRRLRQTRRRLLDDAVRVLVVGEFKQGKSLLVNALVGAPVCPVDDDVATAVPTVVRYAREPSAVLVESTAPGEAWDPDLPVRRRAVPPQDLSRYVSESGNPGNARRLLQAEVGLPRALLSGGLVLVDTPGVGGLGSRHAMSTVGALPTADAVLLVSDASQEYTEPEMQFLRQALRLCPTVACVLTKTDLYPDWRRVAELDREHLDRVRPGLPLLTVSSTLRLHATRTQDAALNEESGVTALVRYLRDDVAAQAARLASRSVAHDVLAVTDHLRLGLQAEQRSLQDPAGGAAMVAELEAARDRVDELRRRSSRWQQTLTDGMTDLVSDLEHDLRDRMRAIGREAEEAIDAGDPAPVWDQFTEWLERRVASAVSDNFVWANERARWLAGQVAEHFVSEGAADLPAATAADLGSVSQALQPVSAIRDLDPGHVSTVQKVLIGMRGSYGGVLMFGLLTGIAGMALVNPISVGAGVLLGGRAYREDRATRLKRRQAEAKSLVARKLDDVVFQVGKQLRDRLRLIQRATRDHFTDVAEELHRSLGESVLAAQSAARADGSEREIRLRAVTEALRRVDALRAEVTGRRPPTTSPARPPARTRSAAP